MTPSDVAQQSVTVVGGARSGRAVATLLAQADARVFLTEHGPPPNGLADAMETYNIPYEVNGHTDRALQADLIVVSPGVPTTAPLIQTALDQGLPVVSEIEVAFWFCEAPIIAITGTNGKTTTTGLVAHVLRKAESHDPDRRVIVAGNVGVAFSEHAATAGPNDVVVLEVSSFQLDHVDTFRPRVSILLNITPDHLNRYGDDVEAYAASKARIMAQQAAGDTIVYNADDVRTRRAITSQASAEASVGAMSQQRAVVPGIYQREEALWIHTSSLDEALMSIHEVSLPGPHNRYNAMAAALAAHAMEAPLDAIRTGLSTFEAVPHRLEPVRTVDNVRFVNDSKATNVDALRYALQSFNTPIVLIAGGRDKGNDYEPLQPLVRDRVRAVIAIGESANTVHSQLGVHAAEQCKANTMEDAIQAARACAHPGDVVLLSPACSSFDMYTNYKERGDVFRRLVQAI